MKNVMTISQDNDYKIKFVDDLMGVKSVQKTNFFYETTLKNKMEVKKKLEETIQNYYNIRIDVEGLTISFTIINHIFSLLIKNPVMLSVTYPEGFFSQQQIKKLNEHIIANRKKFGLPADPACAKEDNKPYFRSFGLSLIFGTLYKFYHCVSIASSVGFGFLMGMGVTFSCYLRNQFIKSSEKHYNKPAKIDALKNDSEITALLEGIKARRTAGYLLSFTKIATYRHPMAFYAGMSQKNEAVIAQIKTLRFRNL